MIHTNTFQNAAGNTLTFAPRAAMAQLTAAVWAAIVCTVLTVAIAQSVLTAAPARAQSCPDIQVVFARGTGEPPGAGRVGDAFTDSLRSLAGARSVQVYGVNYPASREFLRAAQGANDASQFIQN